MILFLGAFGPALFPLGGENNNFSRSIKIMQPAFVANQILLNSNLQNQEKEHPIPFYL
jgi:hypothetical protein